MRSSRELSFNDSSTQALQFNTESVCTQGLRPQQQDSYGHLKVDNKQIIVMADGNGGEGGKELADEAVKAIFGNLCLELGLRKHQHIESDDHLRQIGLNAIDFAAQEVMSYKECHDIPNAGTTLTLNIITNRYCSAFWVGDSPSYIYSNRKLLNLTNPVHTLAEKLVREGVPRASINQQESLNHILTMCLGHDACRPDATVIPISTPSLLLTGSDGVIDYLDPVNLEKTIREKISCCLDLRGFVKDLVSLSLSRGSTDNCTLIVTIILPEEQPRKVTYRLTQTRE